MSIRIDKVVKGNLVFHEHDSEDLVGGYVALSPASSTRNVIQPTGDYDALTINNSSGTNTFVYYPKNGQLKFGNAIPASLSTTASGFHIYSEGINATCRIHSLAANANPSYLQLFKGRGTVASTTAALSGDGLGTIFLGSWRASSSNWFAGASISAVATEDWTSGKEGTRLDFSCKKTGTATIAVGLKLYDLNVGVGASTPTAKLHVFGESDQIQTIIKGYSSQTANLTEWQNSSGTVYSSISSSFQGLIGVADALTTDIGNALYLSHYTSGTPSTNFGTGLVFRAQNGSGTQSEIAKITSLSLPAGTMVSGAEYTGIDFYTKNNGTYGKALRIDNSLQAIFYGTGIFTKVSSSLGTAGALSLRTGGWAGGSEIWFGIDDAYSKLNIIRSEIVSSSGSGSADLIIAGKTATGSTLETVRIYGAGGQLITGTTDRQQLIVKGYSSQTANLTEWQNSSGTNLVYIGPKGTLYQNAVISGTAAPSYLATYNQFATRVGYTDRMFYGVIANAFRATANGRIDGDFVGANFVSAIEVNSTTIGGLVGGYFYVSSQDNTSGYATSYVAGKFGVGALVSSGTPTVASIYGNLILTPNKSAGVTITDGYGLYIQDQDISTNNYAIYTNAGLVRFGDNVSTTGSMSAASFILTSPDGTKWRISVADDGSLITSEIGTPLGLALLLTT